MKAILGADDDAVGVLAAKVRFGHNECHNGSPPGGLEISGTLLNADSPPTRTQIPKIFDDQPAAHVRGRSSKSFLREGRWEPVLREKPDFVFIQFGHNDQPGKGDRTTDANGDFQDNLRKFIDEARAAGSQPVLVTPVARRIFENGKAVTTLTPYADAMQKVAAEKKVPLVDLHRLSFGRFDELGDAASADLSASAKDRTHFSRKGAKEIARLVAQRLSLDVPALRVYLRQPWQVPQD